MIMPTRETDHLAITGVDRLERIRGEWEDIHKASRLESPFLTIEYLRLWYSCFAKPHQMRIYRAIQEGKTVGFMPMVLRKEGPFRVLSSLSNDHCLHSEPLVMEGCEAPFQEAVLNTLLENNSWDLLRYNFSNSCSAMSGLFSDELLDRSGLAWHRETQPTYLVQVDKPFDDYFKGDLSPKFRKNIKMYRKRLAKAGESRVRNLTGGEAVASWSEFVRIEGSGWKGRGGTSIDSLDTSFQEYYRGLIQLLAASDALHIYFLDVNDEPVAAAFCYCEGEMLHYAKIGYLEQHGALSPSNLLLMEIIEDVRVSCPGVRIVNMFPWSEGYKHRFANVEATCSETMLYNRTARGQLVRLTHGLRQAARRTPGFLWMVNTARRLCGRRR
jgi:CelD/BcsL family acetyltransferase involved in cellulose biosynthesis